MCVGQAKQIYHPLKFLAVDRFLCCLPLSFAEAHNSYILEMD